MRRSQQNYNDNDKALVTTGADANAYSSSSLPLDLLFESTPSCIVTRSKNGLCYLVFDLVALRDGSFLSYHADCTVKRWIAKDNNNLRCHGTYAGHGKTVQTAIEIGNDTIVTGSRDNAIKVWNKTTYECLRTKTMDSPVVSLLKTKKNSYLICGLAKGTIQVLQLRDFHPVVVADFGRPLGCVCELEDGTFIVGLSDQLKRWYMRQTHSLPTFSGHSGMIYDVIELKQDIIVSASEDETLKIWRVSSGECLHSIANQHICQLVQLKEGYFARAGYDMTIRINDENGSEVATYQTDYYVTALARLKDGSIVSGNTSQIEIRKP